MTRVLIAGESEVLRRGLESLVRAARTLELVGSVEDISELGRLSQETAPDVILAAVSSLEEFIQEAEMLPRSEGPSQPALVVLVSDSSAISEARRAGIAGLLRRDATTEEILAAIHAATLGLVVLDPAMMEAEKEEEVAARHFMSGARVPQLTARELEVLNMLAEGLGNKEIAWRLKISEHTVKFHLSSIFGKLDVSSRAEAVSMGFRLGLILI